MPWLILCHYTHVTGSAANEQSQILEIVKKVIQNRTLHGSESLCKLLRYLAEQSLDHPGAPVKEYQIATFFQDGDVGVMLICEIVICAPTTPAGTQNACARFGATGRCSTDSGYGSLSVFVIGRRHNDARGKWKPRA